MSKNSWVEDTEFKFFIVVKMGKLIVKLLMNQLKMMSVNREIVKWGAPEASSPDLHLNSHEKMRRIVLFNEILKR